MVAALWDRWLQEFNASSEKVDEIETKLKDAETKLEKAKKELEEAEQKYEAKASVQAGPAQAGGFCVCSCCCCLRFAAFPHGRRVSRAVHRCCFLGVMLSSQDLLVVKLSPLCWLPAVRGEWEGLSEQRALGCFRFMQN